MNPPDNANNPQEILPLSDELNARADLLPRIRSYVRREGRMTRAQQRALQSLWHRFGVEAGVAPLDPVALFGRRAPLVLEIGFGDGESLTTMASTDRSVDYLGVEVHRPGIGHLLLRAEALALTNLRVICADAVEVLEQNLLDRSLDRIQIFFPDPWPKARHHKRRLIQPLFATLLARKLKPGGQLHVATDCEDYARAILNMLDATPGLTNQAKGNGFMPYPAGRPPTKFEQRGWRLGHRTWDILFVRSNHRA
jgi:tRNA (guanine-N7-)-methyltransferase